MARAAGVGRHTAGKSHGYRRATIACGPDWEAASQAGPAPEVEGPAEALNMRPRNLRPETSD